MPYDRYAIWCRLNAENRKIKTFFIDHATGKVATPKDKT